MAKPQRVKIKHPITHQELEGTGEYTKDASYGHYVWDITLDNGERLKLAEHEADFFYKASVTVQKYHSRNLDFY